MATNSFNAHCPDCGTSLPPQSRFCPQCGRHQVSDETLEQPAHTVIGEPTSATHPQGALYPPTMHQIHRRPLGIHPVVLLGGLAGLALVVAIVLLAVGALVDGLILLGLAIGLLTLFLGAVRREPDAPPARLIRLAADRVRSLATLAVVTLRAWARVGANLPRIRHRQRRLRREFQSRLAPLGEAVYRGDGPRAETLTQQAVELDQELEEAQREASSVIDEARRKIERERATVEPTQSLPRAR